MIDSEALSGPSSRSPEQRKQFRLTGKSVAVDRNNVAARKDLADIELADRVFAPHYSRALHVSVVRATEVRCLPLADADIGSLLSPGDMFHLLDLGSDWAWGRGIGPGSVGYVRCDALALK